MPKRTLIWMTGAAILLFLIALPLGSEGTTEGDPDTAQQIANVLFPLSILLLLATAVVGIVSAVRLARRGREGS